MQLPARLALLLVAIRTGALPTREVAAPPLPCGITDPAGRTGFLVGPSSTIEAVDLVTGEVLWSSAEARQPLFVFGGRLYALSADSRRPRIRGFDVENRGVRVFESDPLPLPEWSSGSDGHGRSLAVRCQLERSALLLAWEIRQARERRKASGLVRIDLTTGAVKAANEAAPEPPRKVPHELERMMVRWQNVSGTELRALVLEEDGNRQKFVLRTWDLATSKPQPPRELLTGRKLMVLPTVDDRFLCLRDAAEAEDAKKAGWSIIAAATGERVARTPWEPGTQAVALIGPRVFYLLSGPVRGPIHRPFLHPRSLRAIDVKTGKTLWERPVEGKPVTPP